MKIFNSKHYGILILSLSLITLSVIFHKLDNYFSKDNQVCGNVVAVEKIDKSMYNVNLNIDNTIKLVTVSNSVPVVDAKYCVNTGITFLQLLALIFIFLNGIAIVFCVIMFFAALLEPTSTF